MPERPGDSEGLAAVTVGVVTVSDRAHAGVYEDRGGPAAVGYLQRALHNPLQVHTVVVPDEVDRVAAAIVDFVDDRRCSVVLTTGGTGPAPRDVTPEATVAVCDKLLPGFGEQMRRVSSKKVPTAILSRQTAGVRGSCLVINLPGSPKAVDECLDAVMAAIPDCLDLIGGPRVVTDPRVVVAFRPHEHHHPPEEH